jgi:hypothetical protein
MRNILKNNQINILTNILNQVVEKDRCLLTSKVRKIYRISKRSLFFQDSEKRWIKIEYIHIKIRKNISFINNNTKKQF